MSDTNQNTNQSKTVVVHGASGSQGAPVLRRLVHDGYRVRAITRGEITRGQAARSFPAGAIPAKADLADAESLAEAYLGADAVYLQLPLEFGELALAQAEAALRALVRAGVPQVVFNTNLGYPAREVGAPFVDARARLIAELPSAAPKVTVTGPEQVYMDNLALPFSRRQLAAGKLVYPLPGAAEVAWVAARDLAAVVSATLRDPDPPLVRLVRGPQCLTGKQAAAAVTEGLGRHVEWETITPERYGELLAPVIGAAAAAGIAASYASPAAPAQLDPAWTVNGKTTLAQFAMDRLR